MKITQKGRRQNIAAIQNDGLLIIDPQSALDLAATVHYAAGVRRLIIPKECVAEEFFTLSTQLAGEILQKYVNYGIKLAIVGDFSGYASKPLRDFIYESNRGRDFFFVPTEEEAVRRLEADAAMPGGILVFGANGSGKSTLGRALARFLDFKYMDIEDYCFIKSEAPYTVKRAREDYLNLMLADMKKHGSFVLSAVTGDFGAPISSLYDFAVYLSAPRKTRLERIEKRAYEQYGERVREGGDMREQHLKFVDFVASRPLDDVQRWAETLTCPVLRADGTKPISDNVKWAAEQYLSVRGITGGEDLLDPAPTCLSSEE